MIKFGIDWTFYDLNFVKYKDKFGVFGGNADYLGVWGLLLRRRLSAPVA